MHFRRVGTFRHRINNEGGMILITTLLLSIIIIVFSTSLFARTFSEKKMLDFETNKIISFNLAEAGIDDAIYQLYDNSSYTGTGVDNPVTLGQGSYATVVTTPDPANNPNIRRIVAIGYAPNNQSSSYGYQERTITTYLNLDPQPLYKNAVFAQANINLTGDSKIDSYNSGLGDYGPGNMAGDGDIATNSAAEAAIDLKDDTLVSGDAVIGPQGDTNTSIALSGNAAITGNRLASSRAAKYDPVTVPDGLIYSGDLSVSGSDIMPLPAGTYWYNEINISGSGKLDLQGPVTIYATGDVDITASGVITPGNMPENFILNVVGDKRVVITGSGQIYGVIYAPESGKFTAGVGMQGIPGTGNAEIFGAIIAHEFTASDTSVHYDESLKNSGNSSQSNTDMVSWQES